MYGQLRAPSNEPDPVLLSREFVRWSPAEWSCPVTALCPLYLCRADTDTAHSALWKPDVNRPAVYLHLTVLRSGQRERIRCPPVNFCQIGCNLEVAGYIWTQVCLHQTALRGEWRGLIGFGWKAHSRTRSDHSCERGLRSDYSCLSQQVSTGVLWNCRVSQAMNNVCL